jgi:hypothetical protein
VPQPSDDKGGFFRIVAAMERSDMAEEKTI